MATIFSLFSDFFAENGPALVDKGQLQLLLKEVLGAVSGVVAHAGGGQAAATSIGAQAGYVSVDTCASDNDSVSLPPAVPGSWVVVNNNTAHSLQVFGVPNNSNNGGAGDTITAHNSATPTATATGVAQPSANGALYVCFALGNYKQFLWT